MNLRQIEVFAEVMRTGSVTEGAKALNVSQPSVSKMLSYIESRLKLTLFERKGGRIVPTPEAYALYRESEQVMQALEHFQHYCRDLGEFGQIPLLVNAEALIGQVLIPHAIAGYRKNWPEGRFRFEIHNSLNIANHVKWRQADLGFVHFPADEAMADVRILRTGRMVSVLHKNHPFSNRDCLVTDDLRQTSVVYCHGGMWLKNRLQSLMPKGENGQVLCEIEVNQFANGCLLVEQTQSVMLIDDLAQLAPISPDLVFIPFEPTLEVSLGVLNRQHEPLSRPAQRFIDQVECSLQELESALGGRRQIP